MPGMNQYNPIANPESDVLASKIVRLCCPTLIAGSKKGYWPNAADANIAKI
jgi:hypothetical protein